MQLTIPEPSSFEQAHSIKLIELIAQEIQSQGPLSFARYMEMALYQPGLGYYVAGTKKFGAGGDFVTAPEISSLFSQCLARQAAEVLELTGSQASILEVGAGSGVMAVDVMQELQQLEQLPRHYFILELSPELKQRQRERIAKHAPELLERFVWLDTLDGFSMQGLVLANEVLDAQPATCFEINSEGLFERKVNFSDSGFFWELELAGQSLQDAVANLGLQSLSIPYRSELNLNLLPWLKAVSAVIEAGSVLLIDYGYERADYYHPERTEGTLIGHYQHQVIDEPLVFPGLMDLTVNVDFTAVAEAAVASGFEFSGYTSQAAFLLGSGLDHIFTEQIGDDEQRRLELSQQIKRLTLPSEMGERFKVIGLNKGLDHTCTGFNFNDLSHRL